MTKEQIDSILDRVRTWPASRQEDAVQVLLAMETEAGSPYRLTDDERADIEEALAEIERGDVASDSDVKSVFDRYRR